MKVVALNGSPRRGVNISQCLEVMVGEFAREGIDFEVLQPGLKVHPWMACYHCLDKGSRRRQESTREESPGVGRQSRSKGG